jgi:hypothetical protein
MAPDPAASILAMLVVSPRMQQGQENLSVARGGHWPAVYVYGRIGLFNWHGFPGFCNKYVDDH